MVCILSPLHNLIIQIIVPCRPVFHLTRGSVLNCSNLAARTCKKSSLLPPPSPPLTRGDGVPSLASNNTSSNSLLVQSWWHKQNNYLLEVWIPFPDWLLRITRMVGGGPTLCPHFKINWWYSIFWFFRNKSLVHIQHFKFNIFGPLA